MQLGIVFHIQSYLIFLMGISQSFPLFFSLYYEEKEVVFSFLISIAISVVLGLVLHLFTRKYRQQELRIRESFGVVSFGWIFSILMSTVPFLIYAHGFDAPLERSIFSFTDAYFEMTSGLTTTGSSILSDIEALPYGLLFWRSFTQWLGGMGIIVLTLAILPAIGLGGMQMYNAEVPGPTTDRIVPRVSQIAKLLWGVYLLLTVLETLLLLLGGMNLFDALCHSFGTVATGGFSTKNLSIGFYDSPYIEGVVLFFMFLGSTSFVLHYRLLRGDFRGYFQEREFRFFFICLVIGILVLFLDHFVSSGTWNITSTFRFVVFQTMSILTTTGYSLGIAEGMHFGLWSSFSQFFLVWLMLIGGTVGSTSGGLKCFRIYLIFQLTYNEMLQLISPRRIRRIRLGPELVSDSVISSTLGFLGLYVLLLGVAILILNLLEKDLLLSVSAVIATLNNIGPGFGEIGPDGNFSGISTAGKWVLIFCMLLGRLEFYSLLLLFAPSFWKRD